MVDTQAAAGQTLTAFPLLSNPSTYKARTFDYFAEYTQNGVPAVGYKDWLEMFRASIAPFQRKASQDSTVVDAGMKAAKFAQDYGKLLDILEENPNAALEGIECSDVSCVYLCKLREICLRAAGFTDIYASVKRSENEKALRMLPNILSELDADQDEVHRIQNILRGVFAGNVFDLGAEASAKLFEKAGSAFVATRDSLVPRPWAIDDFDEVVSRLIAHRYRKALLFVDNAGSDVVLGMLPLMRELAARGTIVVAAANSEPSINDVTASELRDVVSRAAELDPVLQRAVAESVLAVVESGSDLPVIDLSQVSEELAKAADGVDLVVLEGMGRSIETNLHAQMTVDKLNLGMIKHPEVATMLGGRLYDCVCKFAPGSPSESVLQH